MADNDKMEETAAVLADPVLLAAHREGQAALAAGDYLDATQLARIAARIAARSAALNVRLAGLSPEPEEPVRE